MVIIIMNNFAHRQLRNGQIESDVVTYDKDRKPKFSNNWKVRSYTEMNMSSGDMEIVRNEIEKLSAYIPPIDYQLPKSQPIEPVRMNFNEVIP